MNEYDRTHLRISQAAAFVAQKASVLDELAQDLRLSDRHNSLRPTVEAQHVRTLFISDVHLGSKGCRASELVSFLRNYRTDQLYLVGDIFDTWRPMWPNWTQEHDQVVRAILDMQRAGAKLTFLPGNHDALFHRFHGDHFGVITVMPQAIHTTADGQRLLVTHGDCCDIFVDRAPWLAQIGASLESGMRILHHGINTLLTRAGRPRWNGVEDLLNLVNQEMRKHDRFEERLASLARRSGVDGVVCGHFHQPALHRNFGVTYANCGDWVEDQTAIVEAEDGSLSLIDWASTAATSALTYPQLGHKPEVALAN